MDWPAPGTMPIMMPMIEALRVSILYFRISLIARIIPEQETELSTLAASFSSLNIETTSGRE